MHPSDTVNVETGELLADVAPDSTRKMSGVKVQIIHYDDTTLEERQISGGICELSRDVPGVTWINVDGMRDGDIFETIGNCYDLHPLVLEDILSADQRPKVDDYEHYLYIVIKMLRYNEAEGDVDIEQVSVIFGSGFVISFQQGKEGDVFDPIRERLRTGKGRLRKLGADYLAYSLLDAIVDNYFVILERIGDKVDLLEEELVANPKPEKLDLMHNLKREMLFLRNSVWPLREVISNLERGDTTLIQDVTRVYLRDVYDHTIQVIETVETFRDMLSGMLDIYLSSISNRLNEVMKVLTIISTIFMPMTFVASLFGMNFSYIPGLKSSWGFPFSMAIMLAIGLVMLAYFRRKRWL
jgi:magnesium transporter